jgi:hypothetical protein
MTRAVVFAALYAAHEVGDHWIQTGTQAAAKGLPGRAGRLACARPVAMLTTVKAAAVASGGDARAAGSARWRPPRRWPSTPCRITGLTGR